MGPFDYSYDYEIIDEITWDLCPTDLIVSAMVTKYFWNEEK